LLTENKPILVAVRSKEWDCGGLLAGIAGSNPTKGKDDYFECCLLSGRDFWVQSSPTEWGVSECDREASVMRAPWPNRGGITP